MDTIWIPLLSALFGALIGSGTTIMSIVVQNHFQNKRENTKLAFEAAIQDYKTAAELVKTIKPAYLSPLAAYVCYHSKLIDLALEKRLTKESLNKLDEEMDQLHEAFRRKPKKGDTSKDI
jgi:hypothetical protein